ncbi:TlpA family protein disulfide reductase [Niabella sp. CC-SYL272]|uniref:TlpA family protein disulfide reductase n=1 Tax=Niabella agricola TaxID=2891571 RepID=UPI001F296143|nr:TlpA disulfide reductase family protein [Niabella agricola]MCF3109617.1 TlpA family protein disulfide reductase [Niabella agricola]
MKIFPSFILIMLLAALHPENRIIAQSVIITDTSLFKQAEDARLELFNGGVDDRRTNTLVSPLVKDGKCFFNVPHLADTIYFVVRGVKQAFPNALFLIFPKDTVEVLADQQSTRFLGSNSSVYECIYKIAKLGQTYLNEQRYPQRSLDDKRAALEYLSVCKQLYNDQQKIITAYSGKIPPRIYKHIIDQQLLSLQADACWMLNRKIIDQQTAAAYVRDSLPEPTFYDTGIKSISYPRYIFEMQSVKRTKIEGNPKLTFNEKYDFVYNNFKGEKRKQLMAYILTGPGRSVTLNVKQAAFYKANTDPVFRPVYEALTKVRITGTLARNFSLTGVDGKVYSLDSFKDKVIVIDFWFTGCGACVHMTPVLARAAKKLEGKQVVFLSVCVDESSDKWKKSLKGYLYSFDGAVKLYTQGEGMAHPIIKDYNVVGYPTIVVLSKERSVLPLKNDPRADQGQNLMDSINAYLDGELI